MLIVSCRNASFSDCRISIAVNAPQQPELLRLLQSRPHQDAYYRVYYREGDTNVELRLRAWRPKGEVLLPWTLRQSITKEGQLPHP